MINLRHSRDFTSLIPIGNLVLLCMNVFFLHMAFFFSSGHGSFLVLSAAGHAGSTPENHGASVGPGRGPWRVRWGFKSQVTTGRHSEHVEPSRPMQTHVQVKKMSDGSCDIWDLECRQCRQTLLGDGKVFPRHQLARHATTFSTIRYTLLVMTSEG